MARGTPFHAEQYPGEIRLAINRYENEDPAKVVRGHHGHLTLSRSGGTAAIVLNDMDRRLSMPGHRRAAVGNPRPWFILAVMLSPPRWPWCTSRVAACLCAAASIGFVKEAMADAGQVLRFGVDVRLHPYRADQRRLCGPVSGGFLNDISNRRTRISCCDELDFRVLRRAS